MLNRLSNPLHIALILTLVAIVVSACTPGERSHGDGDFVIELYHGGNVTTAGSIGFDELVAGQGRPVLLNFWASNCPPCRAEMPALEAAWREYGDSVLFIGVDVGPYVGLGSYEAGRALIEELGVTYVTGNTRNRTVVTDWQLNNMPSTFFLNTDGRVNDIVIGAIPGSRINDKIRELIAFETDRTIRN